MSLSLTDTFPQYPVMPGAHYGSFASTVGVLELSKEETKVSHAGMDKVV